MAVLHRPVPALPRRGPAGSGAPPASVHAMRAIPALSWFPVAAVGSVLVLALVAPGAAERLAWPIAIVGAVLGIPHGAVDHLVPWWWAGRRPRPAAVLRFAVGYAGVAAVALCALLVAPPVPLAFFLLLSAVHFGRGEVAAWAERAGRPVPAATADVLPGAAAGGVVVGALVWAAPAATDPLLRNLSPELADLALATRDAGLVAVAVVVGAGLAALAWTRRFRDCSELGLLAAAFALAPPLAAFGMYFGCWHAVRHTGRLLDLARDANDRAGRDRSWRVAAVRLARAGAAPTAVALLAVAGLWSLRGSAPLEAQVSILLALTFPHAAVVWALDRRGGSRAGPGARRGDPTSSVASRIAPAGRLTAP